MHRIHLPSETISASKSITEQARGALRADHGEEGVPLVATARTAVSERGHSLTGYGGSSAMRLKLVCLWSWRGILSAACLCGVC